VLGISYTLLQVGDQDTTPYENLVAGVVWLVKDGKSFVRTSWRSIEDHTTQETGGDFDTIVSARNAIGHDEQGRCVRVPTALITTNELTLECRAG